MENINLCFHCFSSVRGLKNDKNWRAVLPALPKTRERQHQNNQDKLAASFA